MVTQSDVQGWVGELDAVLGRIASRLLLNPTADHSRRFGRCWRTDQSPPMT